MGEVRYLLTQGVRQNSAHETPQTTWARQISSRSNGSCVFNPDSAPPSTAFALLSPTKEENGDSHRGGLVQVAWCRGTSRVNWSWTSAVVPLSSNPKRVLNHEREFANAIVLTEAGGEKDESARRIIAACVMTVQWSQSPRRRYAIG